MYFSQKSILLTSTALLSLVSSISAADVYSDAAVAPDPDSTEVETTKTENVATKASCTPTSYSTPRTFQLKSEPGRNCSYNSFIDIFDTDVDKQKGIQQCKNKCTKTGACRTFSWFLDSARPGVGNCWLDYYFYESADLQCDPSTTNTYLAVYNVSNWTPLNPLIPNGDFESGCFKPWFFQDFTSDSSMRKTVVNCDKSTPGDCAPQGGSRYIRIRGNGANGSSRDHIDAYIGQLPPLTDGVNYKLTAQIRGDSGQFRFTYPVHTSVIWKGNATKEWSKIEAKFTGRNVGTFLIQMDAPDMANFAIDNVKVVIA